MNISKVRNFSLAVATAFAGWAAGWPSALAQTTASISVDTSSAGRQQTIDGFGTCLAGAEAQQTWWQNLYYDDLRCSILRLDLTPQFTAPYSDFTYNSPWFHANPSLPGPDGNNVRTYTSALDYTRNWNSRRASIAVMGPNIDTNASYFDADSLKTAGLAAQAGLARRGQLGDFKLIGSLWSPAPWLKVSSGNSISGQSGILPVNGTAWPFIWGGNFAGGRLDTSDTPLAVFNDSALGGTGPTSALTQFARCTAAYLRNFQNRYGLRFYAVSVQNELNFEVFYNSCTYPLSSQYIAALKRLRTELDKYPDLKNIKLQGPEDLLGSDAYSLWQYGGGSTAVHKNLQYLQNVAADPQAAAALDFFSIHGYAPDGVSSAGSDPISWNRWDNGWTTSPAGGIPSNVPGFTSYGKKSWMTETSGENPAWLFPSSGFPNDGGFSIALKLHQALTAGRESAWVYWQMTDGSPTAESTLTDATALATAPKYVAAKHFFANIRPGAVRVNTTVTTPSSTPLLATSYLHDTDHSLVMVLINPSPTAVAATIQVPRIPQALSTFQTRVSSNGNYWQSSTLTTSNQQVALSVPGYGVATLYGIGIALDPTTVVGRPIAGKSDDGRLQITFTRDSSRSEFSYTVEASNDLVSQPWPFVIATSSGGAPFVGVNGGTVSESGAGSLKTVTVKDVLMAGYPRRFLRVRINY